MSKTNNNNKNKTIKSAETENNPTLQLLAGYSTKLQIMLYTDEAKFL